MDRTNANTALASAFVEELARCGLRHAVLSPGSRSTPLALALWRQEEIDVTVIVDERSAAFFALGAAQASGAPVAILSTSGTAAANFHPAICEADESAVPLLALTADRPPELRGIGAGQTLDQIKLYGSAVRWFCEVGTHTADDDGLLHYRSVACRAFATAAGEGRPGPVHLNLPWREPLAPVRAEGAVTATDTLALEGRDGRPLTAATALDREPSEFLLEEVAKHIEAAGAGVIVAGRQLDPELREPLAHLAEAAGFPILAEPTSQVRCGPHDLSHVVSSYDLLLRDDGFAGRMRPDLVLRFGEMPTSKPLRAWLAASGADQIVVDPYGGWNEPTRRAAAMVRADPVELAAGWAARVGRGDRDIAEAWLASERLAVEAVDAEIDADGPISEPALHRALGAAHRDGDLVYTASSMPIRDQETYLAPAPADALFLCNRGANGIDGLVSSGIGAAAASGRPTTIVTGDLGLLHDLGGLAAVREVATPVRILVIDNEGGGIFHFLPQAEELGEEEFESLLGTPRGIDAARAAALFDLPHRRIESLGELPDALAAGTGLIEAPVADRRSNVDLHHRLQTAVSQALAALR
jgi:2-succinyl-5-enolpyruvyl-6-hydroxy-3-cyclohexene-1-carboxylate synthase